MRTSPAVAAGSRAVGLLVGAALLYIVAVRFAPGQGLDDLGFEGRKAVDLGARRSATALARLTVPVVAVLGALWVVAMTFRQGAWRLAFALLLGIAATAASARWLKLVLPRDQLFEVAYASPANSFPSGHVALAVAVALAAVSACTPVLRGRVAAAATVLVVGSSTAVLGSGWHRPSDVAAAVLFAAGMLTLATVTAWRDVAPGDGDVPPWYRKPRATVRLVSAVAAASAVTLIVLRNRPANPDHPFLVYLVIVVAVNCSAALVVQQHARWVDGPTTPPDRSRG